jgi:hypothetical protein
MDDTRWQDWYRRHGPQRPYAHRPGLDAKAPAGEIEYASGAVLRLADLLSHRPNWRESTDGTLREREREA